MKAGGIVIAGASRGRWAPTRPAQRLTRFADATARHVQTAIDSPGGSLADHNGLFASSPLEHDFSQVQLHHGSDANRSARLLGARAYTAGEHIVFAEGEYAPSTPKGRRLLWHELTHVAQQRSLDAAEIERDHVWLEDAAARGSNSAAPLTPSARARDARKPLVVQRDRAPGPAADLPIWLREPSGIYIDDFIEVVYDIDYRGEPQGALSKWMQVRYADGSKLDVQIDVIEDRTVQQKEAEKMRKDGHIGIGGVFYPTELNHTTTPRLAAAKRQVQITMDDYNALFIMGAFSAVWLIIVTAGMPPLGEMPVATRRPMPRLPTTREEPPLTGEEVPGAKPPSATAKGPAEGETDVAPPQAKQQGPPKGPKAAKDVPPEPPLTAAQAAMRDDLMSEHPGLNSRVAAEAVKGGTRVAGRGGEGADVALVSGGGREVTVHTGAFTQNSIGGHLVDKVGQRGTTEIYMQINTPGASSEGLQKMMPTLRRGYPELKGTEVRIFGPQGQQWWRGTFQGPQ